MLKERHPGSLEGEILKRVIARLEKIERAEHQDMSDAHLEALNAIATMQAEAKMAITELKPLVYDLRVERSPGDVPIGKGAHRARWGEEYGHGEG